MFPLLQGVYETQHFPFVCGIVTFSWVELSAHTGDHTQLTFDVLLTEGGPEGRTTRVYVDNKGLA